MSKQKLKIKLHHWDYTCGDGCCSTYGMTTTVNGVELALYNEDVETNLKQVLEHLGYEVEIEETYDDDSDEE